MVVPVAWKVPQFPNLGTSSSKRTPTYLHTRRGPSGASTGPERERHFGSCRGPVVQVGPTVQKGPIMHIAQLGPTAWKTLGSRMDPSSPERAFVDQHWTLGDMVKATKWPFVVTKYMNRSALTREQDGGKISALSQIARRLLTKNYRLGTRYILVWPDLEDQLFTQVGKLAHHWIQNVLSYPLVWFVAKLYHNRGRGGAGVPPPGRYISL